MCLYSKCGLVTYNNEKTTLLITPQVVGGSILILSMLFDHLEKASYLSLTNALWQASRLIINLREAGAKIDRETSWDETMQLSVMEFGGGQNTSTNTTNIWSSCRVDVLATVTSFEPIQIVALYQLHEYSEFIFPKFEVIGGLSCCWLFERSSY